MDWKSFAASLVSSLAWPIAVVAVALVFRERIRFLLSHVREIGAGGVNLKMADRVESAISAGEAVEAEKGLSAPEVIGLDPSLLQLTQSFPAAGLVQAFKELESVILHIRTRLPEDKQHRNLNEVMKALFDKGYIPSSAIALFRSLREARNLAAHSDSGGELTSVEAIELIRQIKLLQGLLSPVLDELPPLKSRI